MSQSRIRRATKPWPGLMLALSLLMVLPDGAGAQDTPAPTVTSADAEAGPKVTIKPVGFTEANAALLKAHAADLRSRLRLVGVATAFTVDIELVPGNQGVIVTVSERVAGEVPGLTLAPFPMMGARALVHTRAVQTAIQVNAWVGAGPLRAAFEAGNMPLAAALGSRGIGVKYVNDRGEQLGFLFEPQAGGRVVLLGPAVMVGRSGTDGAVVEIDRATGVVPLPVGADGRPTPSALLYGFFGIKP